MELPTRTFKISPMSSWLIIICQYFICDIRHTHFVPTSTEESPSAFLDRQFIFTNQNNYQQAKVSTKKGNKRSTFTSPLSLNSWKQQLPDLFRYTDESQPWSQCKWKETYSKPSTALNSQKKKPKKHLKGIVYKTLLVLASFHYTMWHFVTLSYRKSPLLHRLILVLYAVFLKTKNTTSHVSKKLKCHQKRW